MRLHTIQNAKKVLNGMLPSARLCEDHEASALLEKCLQQGSSSPSFAQLKKLVAPTLIRQSVITSLISQGIKATYGPIDGEIDNRTLFYGVVGRAAMKIAGPQDLERLSDLGNEVKSWKKGLDPELSDTCNFLKVLPDRAVESLSSSNWNAESFAQLLTWNQSLQRALRMDPENPCLLAWSGLASKLEHVLAEFQRSLEQSTDALPAPEPELPWSALALSAEERAMLSKFFKSKIKTTPLSRAWVESLDALNNYDFDSNALMVRALGDSKSDAMCEAVSQRLLEQVWGQNPVRADFSYEDIDSPVSYPLTNTLGPRLLNEFVRGSMKVDKFENPLDQRRRNACRTFKMKFN